MMRTHYFGEIDESLVGQEIEVCGWVHRRRDHGGVIFIDLRDREGLLQVVFDPDRAEIFALAERIRSEFVLKVKGFDADEMTACTLVFEGSKREVAAQQRDVYRIAAKHGGMNGGASNGKRGYQLTYGIAYLRDWILNHWLLAESFETSAAWTDALNFVYLLTLALAAAGAALAIKRRPSWPLLAWILFFVVVTNLFFYPSYMPGRYRLPIYPALAAFAVGLITIGQAGAVVAELAEAVA